ncbi:Nn.00g045110.m01.CDS01 [Neocucurbitaria sp. VM-36]
MAFKRKQLDIEAATNTLPLQPAKKIKPSSQDSSKATSKNIKKRKTPDDDPDGIKVYQSPAKKTKLSPDSTPKVDPKALAKCDQSTLPKHLTAKSKLIPRGDRTKARLGQQDDSLLRILCDDSKTGEAKELHFRKIPHSMIDWNSPQHISDINSWRNQIYGRAGVKAKQVTIWHEEEELWFELYFHLSIAESRTRGILIPKTKAVLEAFNESFVGRVLKDKDGNSIEARRERQLNAFASKFNRICPHLRARLHQSVFGKSGDMFVPKITDIMLKTYQQMKAEMCAQGIIGESDYSDNLEEWQHFLSHLPSYSNVETQDIPTESAEDIVKAKEDDAAAALLSLSHEPIHLQEALVTEGEDTASKLFDIEITNLNAATPPAHMNLTPPYKSPEILQDVKVAAIKSNSSTSSVKLSSEPSFQVVDNKTTPEFLRTSSPPSVQSSGGPHTPAQLPQPFDNRIETPEDDYCNANSPSHANALLPSDGNKMSNRTNFSNKLETINSAENLGQDGMKIDLCQEP